MGRLQSSGVLAKSVSAKKELNAVSEVENFDTMILPLLMYWSKTDENGSNADADLNED